MSELDKKVNAAIARLQTFEPEEGYHLAFSGGKDSVVIKALADMAKVKYDAHYRVTSVDPPELVRFIKEYHSDVSMDIPHYSQRSRTEALRGKPITMWNLIPKERFPPTRVARYCCEALKESSGDGRMTITGVRWAESSNRKANQGLVTITGKASAEQILQESDDFASTKRGGVILVNDNNDSRRIIESCYKRSKTLVNPIIDWSDADVWWFIEKLKLPVCKLYAEGWSRLGCIGCPMARLKQRERQFQRWPAFKTMYLKAFDKMLAIRKEHGAPDFVAGNDPENVFNWWMEYENVPEQMVMEELIEDSESEELQ